MTPNHRILRFIKNHFIIINNTLIRGNLKRNVSKFNAVVNTTGDFFQTETECRVCKANTISGIYNLN